MDAQLAAGIGALATAAAAFLRAEIAWRQQRRRLDDVQHQVGADRRTGDP